MVPKAFASIFLALTLSAFAAEPSPPNEESPEDSEMRSPSPDGRYTMRATIDADYEMEKELIELIELPTKRVLVVLSDPKYMPDFPTRDATLHWSTDSQVVAFYRSGRRGGTTTIFARDGDGFAEVKLPDLPDLPDEASPKMAKKHKGGFPNATTIRNLSFVRWLKSGGVVLKLSNAWGGSSGTWGWHITITIQIDAHRRATIKNVVKKEIFDKS